MEKPGVYWLALVIGLSSTVISLELLAISRHIVELTAALTGACS